MQDISRCYRCSITDVYIGRSVEVSGSSLPVFIQSIVPTLNIIIGPSWTMKSRQCKKRPDFATHPCVVDIFKQGPDLLTVRLESESVKFCRNVNGRQQWQSNKQSIRCGPSEFCASGDVVKNSSVDFHTNLDLDLGFLLIKLHVLSLVPGSFCKLLVFNRWNDASNPV